MQGSHGGDTRNGRMKNERAATQETTTPSPWMISF